MVFKFDRKFTEKDIDAFTNKIYNNLTKHPADHYVFDLTQVEWISNQELLLFTAFLKYFIEKSIVFQVLLWDEGISIEMVKPRVAKQIIEIWEVWQIWKVIPVEKYTSVFRINNASIRTLKDLHGYNGTRQKIYSRYGITPFLLLEKISNYDDRKVDRALASLYALNDAMKEIIRYYDCEHPFINNTLSSIITRELYENFLDHFSSCFFNTEKNWAFMSLSLKGKLNEERYDKSSIQKKLRENFEEEEIVQSKGFFFDTQKNEYKNQSYIQFSFLDFGEGIVTTIRDEYLKSNPSETLFADESKILRYAFNYDSSRRPIIDNIGRRNIYIPRGLFDVLNIVKRYEGLIVVRSNKGKILYDFSGGNDFEKGITSFGDDSFFPGTLITLYLPAFKSDKAFDRSAIKPTYEKHEYKSSVKSYLNLYHIVNQVKREKIDFYSNLLSQIKDEIKKGNQEERITYFSFKGYENEKKITNKIIYFLLSDYDINLRNNVIVIHPPNKEIIDEINIEILNLNSLIKNYKIHPLPLIYYDPSKEDIMIQWLGVYDLNDRNKLEDLLFEQFSIAKSDLNEPNNVVGHINYFDDFGNLNSLLPSRNQLIKFYKGEYKVCDDLVVKKIILENRCIEEKSLNKLYLCNGNYYQFEYIQLIKLLNNSKDADLVSEILFRRVSEVIETTPLFYNYIGITSSSHKILNSLVNQGFLDEKQILLLDNYISFDNDVQFRKIRKDTKYILICDIIATGFLTTRLIRKLVDKDSELVYVAVIIDTIDDSFENSKEFRTVYNSKLISLYKYPIEKFRREDICIKEHLLSKEVIRVNPFTNIPITLSIAETNPGNILLSCEDFLNYVEDTHIKVGYLKYYNLIHPYFFDMYFILNNTSFLKSVFDKIKLSTDYLQVFYPEDSTVRMLNYEYLKNTILNDHSIEIYELERFNTTEGWKFPHTANYYNNKIKNKSILIIDDESCSGDSLIQMLDEISFIEIKEVTVLCLVGRVNDQKREFFSKLSQMQTTNHKKFSLRIFFGTHLHILTYPLDDNPNTGEINWLSELIRLSNTPENLRKIARKILAALKPKERDDFVDYKYLPTYKQTDFQIPKKELIKVRDEVGKVIGYRFYKESFDYFNFLIRKYEGSSKEDRNKEIELLCATFLYEPYLYDKLKQVLPDIVDKLEEFVDALIFGNPKRQNRKINIETELSYKWDKKDIIHLFFIVFKGESLYTKLSSINSLKSLIAFLNGVNFGINYFLYKLLHYFPLNKKQLTEKRSGIFLNLFDIILQDNLVDIDSLKEIKIFRSFIATLPSNEDFYSRLSTISENYRKLIHAKLHKESILVNYDIMLVDLAVTTNHFNEINKSKLQENWDEISRFIEAILSFSGSFPAFFLTKLTLLEGSTDHCLRSIHGKLNEAINNLNKESDFENLKYLLVKFKERFLQTESDVFKIFNKISTNDVVAKFSNALVQHLSVDDFVLNDCVGESITIDFPDFFFHEIVLTEIIGNFRHRDKSKKIEIEVLTNKDDSNYISLEIRNHISSEFTHGGGNGLNILQRLNKFPSEIIQYVPNQTIGGDIYTQSIILRRK